MPLWRVERTEIGLSAAPLPIDRAHEAEIAEHWARAHAANPALYDGPVLLVGDWRVEHNILWATCHRSRFRTVLWLRDNWAPALGTWNAFGSGLLRTADGAVLLGEMAGHTANPGRVYCPGGILDFDDIAGTRIDPEACIRRELTEETGLAPGEYRMAPGWLVAHEGRALSLARICDLPWDAGEARAELSSRIARQAQPELSGLHVVRSVADGARLHIPGFTALKLGAVLAA